MTKRITINLPADTLSVIDRLTTQGGRGGFINRAVMHYVETRSPETLRERLKQEALTNAQRDLEIAEEWFALEEESWHSPTESPTTSSPSAARRNLPSLL